MAIELVRLSYGGKNEIYAGLADLFMRDMPEVLVHTKRGTVSESNFDAKIEFEKEV